MLPSEDRDFYGDIPEEKGECIGYCLYCKSEIFVTEKKVEEDGHMFHKDCYILENTNREEGINDY